MPIEPFVISVSFPAGEFGLCHSLRIEHTGQGVLTSESNRSESDIQAIGVYRTEIGATRATELRDNLVMLEKRGLPLSEPLPPGSEMVVITLEQAGKVTERFVDPHTSTAAICQIADQLTKIMEQAYKKPVRVATMDISLPNTELQQNGRMSLGIKLGTQGTQVVKIVNPVAEDGQASGISVAGIRSDLPLEEIWPEHSKNLKVTQDLLVNAETPTQDEPGLLALRPSQTASFSFSIPIDWEPGQYDVRISLETLSSEPEVLNGRITSSPVSLRVVE